MEASIQDIRIAQNDLANNYTDEFMLNNRPKLSERLHFNICGSRYEIREATFQNFPNTKLAEREWRAAFWDDEHEEYYLDRNRSCFKAILTYYQSKGILHKPDDIPEKLFQQELEFYGLRTPITKTKLLPKNNFQRRVWQLFECPESSNWAKAIAWLSCSVVLLSIIIFCIETLPRFASDDGVGTDNNTLYIIEAVCIAWFTVEYIVRFLSSPCKTKFLTGALNIFDLLAILPFYINFVLTDSSMSSLAILRALRLVRVFRIFKLSRYSKGLRILGLTLKASLAELGLLVFFLAVGVILFSSGIYYAETDENGEVFRSIPHAFWWALITMTTVGYGDMYPITFGGKVIGSLCAFSGILAIALPVPVIVANFEHFYSLEHDEMDIETMDINNTSKFDRIRRFFKNIRNNRSSIRRSRASQKSQRV